MDVVVDLSRGDPALLHNRKRRSPATSRELLAKVWETAAQDQPAPAELSEIPQLAGSPAVALVTRRGELAAAATPGRGFRALGRARPGGAALAVPDAGGRLPPTPTRRAQPSQVFRGRRLARSLRGVLSASDRGAGQAPAAAWSLANSIASKVAL